jgi:hypothetical protein
MMQCGEWGTRTGTVSMGSGGTCVCFPAVSPVHVFWNGKCEARMSRQKKDDEERAKDLETQSRNS